MSPASTSHHHFSGTSLGAAAAAAVIFGGAAALGIALPEGAATHPVAPTSPCTVASCHPVNHPVLPGRHDFGARAGSRFRPAPDGSRAPGRP